jgi:hypothetical protein
MEPPGGLAAVAVADAVSALWIAAGGFPGWHLLAVFTLGTILMRSAGCCMNDVADREFDRHVKRTAQRPVNSGKVVGEGGTGAGLSAGARRIHDWCSPPIWSRSPGRLRRWPLRHCVSLCQALRVNAAGRAGCGVQLWHPDGVSPQ